MKRVLALFASVALAAAAGSVFAQSAEKKPAAKADPAKGQVIATQVCAACHAADGNSVQPINPKLAGQIPEYLHKQLVNFKPQGAKQAAREYPVMAGMVANLSAESGACLLARDGTPESSL